MPDPRAEYEQRIARWSEAIARGERTHVLIANLRLAAVAAAAVLAWLIFGPARLPAWWLAVPVAAFAWLAAFHARVLTGNERAARARDLYLRGLQRLDARWQGSGPDGARFAVDHPYARDLDLFGPASLFQLLTVARTEAGEEALAGWLRSPAALADVRARHMGVAELAPDVDFRERLAVAAAEAHVGRSSAVTRWAAAAPVGLSWRVAALHAVVGLVTAVVIALAIAEIRQHAIGGVPPGRISVTAVLLWSLVPLAVTLGWRQAVATVARHVDAASDELSTLRELLATVERAAFTAPALDAIQRRLVTGGVMPSARVARLQTYVSLMEQYQHNPYFRFFGTLLLVGGPIATAIDRWHADHRAALAGWLQAIGELEAFSSLATFAYEHPDYTQPEVVEGEPRLIAEALAHPLLSGGAVPNDVQLGGGAPHVLVVSGSNMSGKSTLLRAIGVNVVLALAGAPVRARRFVMTPMALGATIRVDDSLQAGHSRFYTEILRIRAIVALASGPLPLLFLLDEILHGTNSYDRRIGAEAIVRALAGAGALGLITTHDLALTSLVETLPGLAANVHFSDRIEDGRMVFDYRMRPGVVEHSNALALMRAVGLDV